MRARCLFIVALQHHQFEQETILARLCTCGCFDLQHLKDFASRFNMSMEALPFKAARRKVQGQVRY